jgi:ABC-type transporter Mla MlaB component
MHNGAIMSSEVRHLVDNGRPFPLVRLAGVLDADTASAVRFALLDVLAGQPEAVVVDVSELEVADPAAVAVLRDVHRDTAFWPAANLTLCDMRNGTRESNPPQGARNADAGKPGPRNGARNGGIWRDTGWPVRNDTARVFAELGAPHPGHRVSLDLEPQVGAARRSRELITEACARWERLDLAGSACIVVTELVNNVVSHSRTSMIVLLAAHGDGMSVAVRDRSTAVPSFTGAPAPTSYGGRGMLLIDSVADRWGSLLLANGKVVWAQLTAEPEPLDRAGEHHRDAGMTGPDRG